MTTIFAYGYKETTRKTPVEEVYDLERGYMQAKRSFYGPWSSRQNFIYEELLKPYFEQADGDTIYSAPGAYPDGTIAVASSVRVRGIGAQSEGPNGMAAYEYAVITCEYATPTYNVSGGSASSQVNFVNTVFLEESIDSSIGAIVIPGQFLRKKGTTTKLADVYGKATVPVIQADIIIKQVNIVMPNWGAMKRAMGKVNEYAFITPSGFTVAKGKLRYDGPFGTTKVNPYTLAGEQYPVPVWEMTHRFAYTTPSWNKKIDSTGSWVEIEKIDGKPLFDYWNLYHIFFGEANDGFNKATLASINGDLHTLNVHLNAGYDTTDSTSQTLIASIRTKRMSLGFRF